MNDIVLLDAGRRKAGQRYRRYYERYLWSGGFLALLFGWSMVELGISARLFIEGIPHFLALLAEMFPPNWQVLTGGKVLWSILETLSMAFLGTFLGAIISFVLGILAAGNVTPSRAVLEAARTLMAVERAVPTLVIILLLLVVVGLGPFGGMLALAIGSVGMLGKLFAEAIENVDPKPLEALESAGATKMQIIRYSVLPQVVPSFIANALYQFDINLRAALFLGVVGGGGVGFNLHMAMSLFRYADALAITVVILVMILLAEKTADYLRRKIIGQEVLQ